MHDPNLTNMDNFVCIETVFSLVFFFPPAGNQWRWNNGGGAMEEEIERERERNVEREMSNFVGFRDRFRI